jgi:hypothetical protein
MKKTWYQKEQERKKITRSLGSEHTIEHAHHEKKENAPVPAAGTPAWLLELIAIIEAVLQHLPVSSPESESTRAHLTGQLERLKAGFPK